MPTPSDRSMPKSTGWPAGVDNRSEENALGTDENGNIIALREAQNVDLDARGKPSRRDGYERLIASTRAHSIWRDPAMPFALYADQEELKAIALDFSVSTVFSGLAPGQPLSYALAAGRVYWSNGVQTGAVDANDLSTSEWGIAGPAAQPAASGGGGIGGLDAGTYQVAVTFVSYAGEESGTPRAVAVAVPQGGGITLTNIPQPSDATSRIRIYRTGANGDRLMRAFEVSAGTSMLVLGASRLGAPLKTQFLEPMPPGQIVRQYAGRMWVACGPYLVHSESLRYGQTKLPHDRIGFNADIDMVEPVGAGEEGAGGLFVAAGDRTYWLPGSNPSEMRAQLRFPQGGGVVRGSSIAVGGTKFGLETPELVPYWLSRSGVGCIGLPGGGVMPLREAQAVSPSAEAGASVLRDDGGSARIITALQGATDRGIAITDRLECEVIHHEK